MSVSDFEEGTLLRKEVRELCEHVARTEEALRDCQRDLVAVHDALPAWCGEGSLAERVARVVVVAETGVAATMRRTGDPVGPAVAQWDAARAEEWRAARAAGEARRRQISIIRDEPPLPDPRSLEDNGGDPLVDFKLESDLGGEG